MICIYSSLKLADCQLQYQLLSKVILVDSCFTKVISVKLLEFPINTGNKILKEHIIRDSVKYIASLENGRSKFWFVIYCYYYWGWIDTSHYFINTHAEEK